MDSRVLAFISFLSLVMASKAVQEIIFEVLENNLQLSPGSVISIANASDIFIDIQCLVGGEDNSRREWLIQPGDHSLLTPFSPSQTSYDMDSGILRIYSTFISQNHNLTRNGELVLQCQSSTYKIANLTLTLAPTFLFGPETQPSEANSTDVESLCSRSLPTLPPVSYLTVESGVSKHGTNYSFCYSETILGRFRSRSIVTGGASRRSDLRFSLAFPAEVVEWASSDSSPIRMTCRVGGISSLSGGHSVYIVKNGVRIPETARPADGAYISAANWNRYQTLIVVKRRGSEGVYQCIGETGGGDTSTSIVSSTYINIHYMEEPSISIGSDNPLWRTDNVILLGQPETPREIVLNCSIDAHPIPAISWTRRDGSTVKEVEGVQARTGYREKAYSELRVAVTQLKAEMEFVCTAVIGNRRWQSSMVITAYSPVEFSKNPGVVASPDTPSKPLLSCSATSIPAANIRWYEERGGRATELSDKEDGIVIRERVQEEGNYCTVTSTLEIEQITNVSNAAVRYYCRGENGFFVTNSATYSPLLNLPEKPEVRVQSITERSMIVEWTTPGPSLLALAYYTLTIYHQDSPTSGLRALESIIFRVGEVAETRHTFDDLTPHTAYSVELWVHDVANNSTSSGPMAVQTLEDAPQAPPQAVVAEAENVDSIRVSWSPPPAHLQNGVIRSYSITYTLSTDPSESSVLNNVKDTEVMLHLPLGPGLSYDIKVAAVTVEIGPFSATVVQKTYTLPPSISSGPPIVVPDAEVTENTMTLQLPPVNTSLFSHFWVVAMKLDGSGQFQQSETLMPTATDEAPPTNSPYVVVELSPQAYEDSRLLFVLGDDSKSKEFNDHPDLYRNFPLMAGSTYTVFVRGFVPAIPPSRVTERGTRAKKEAEEDSERQYAVFSDSELLPNTATLAASDSGFSETEILIFVAVGVVCLLVVTVVIVILVVRRRLGAMGRRTPATLADEMKFSNAIGQQPSAGTTNNNTLPRALSMRGDGIKHEEHIYEDPLYLKSNEAYPDVEPTYKVPRPVSPGNEPSNDVGYEVISPTSKENQKQNGWRKETETAKLSVPRQSGYYEVMRHPSSLGKGISGSNLSLPNSSPTPYLKPVGVADKEQITAGYSLLTRPTDHSWSTSPSSSGGGSGGGNGGGGGGVGGGVGGGGKETNQYQNIPNQDQGINHDPRTRNYSTLPPGNTTPQPQEYVEMKPVTPKH